MRRAFVLFVMFMFAFPVELRKVEGKGLTLSSYYKVIGTVYVPKPTQSQADFEAS